MADTAGLLEPIMLAVLPRQWQAARMEQRQAKPLIMSRAEYRAWAEAQPRGRTERVMGEVIAMASERTEHIRVKYSVWLALRTAIRAASLPCEAIGDGITVEVAEDTDYEPDVLVNCGERVPGQAIAASNPIIVVEVFSLSTRSIDNELKLTDYIRVPPIQHYLIFRADKPAVIHHRRHGDHIDTQIRASGDITLDPPGITISIDAIYDETL